MFLYIGRLVNYKKIQPFHTQHNIKHKSYLSSAINKKRARNESLPFVFIGP